jgi:hypothetical protein
MEVKVGKKNKNEKSIKKSKVNNFFKHNVKSWMKKRNPSYEQNGQLVHWWAENE